jgi:PAS domain S-box-containing protein
MTMAMEYGSGLAGARALGRLGHRFGGLRVWVLSLLVAASVLPVVGVGLLVTELSEATLQQSVIADLERLADARGHAIESWIEERPRYVLPALTTGLRRLVVEVVRRTGAPDSRADRELLEALEAVRVAGRFTELSLVDPATGRTLLSTQRGQEGAVRGDSLPFYEVRGLFFGLVRDGARHRLGFAATMDDEVGLPAAILAGHVDLGFLAGLVAEGQPNAGMRVYVVAEGGAILAASRSDEGLASIDSEGVRRALAGQVGASLYVNHAGRPVIGAYRGLPRLQLAVIAEVDQAAALAPVRSLWLRLGIVLAAVCVLAMVTALMLSRSISRPVLALTEAADAIGHGELDHRVSVTAPTELATLACAMNAMAGDLAVAQDEREHRRREGELVAQIARDIHASVDLGIVLQGLVASARELCAADACRIALREPDRDVMLIRHHVGARFRGYAEMTIEPGQGLGGRAWVSRRPCRTDDYASDPRIGTQFVEVLAAEGFVTGLVVPIQRGDDVEGLLYMDNRSPRPFTDADEQILLRLADHAATAIHNAWLYRELRDSRDFLRSIAENSADGIVTADMAGLITYFSPGAERMFGYRADEIIGRRVEEFLEGGTGQAELLRARLREDDRVPDVLTLLRTRDGRPLQVNASLALLRDPAGRSLGTVAILRDDTDRLQLEEQVRHAQKMEAVGRLAGGVAHDFNNLLTVILGRTELLLRCRPLDGPTREEVAIVREAGERAAALTRQLLAFSRRQVLQPRVLNANDVVRGLDRMLRRLLGEDIALVTAVDPSVALVNADPAQLEQVIVNLAVNARDAMPDGGRLTIETSCADLSASYARSHAGVTPGPHVMIAISDTGCGMNVETQRRIFEPFFTTKGPDMGTGLGLATCDGIIKQSGGHIWLYSEVGKGTTFKIYLPAVVETAGAVPAAGSEPVAGGSETILLVEDEREVRAIARESLEAQGYTVLEAGNADEALALSEADATPIDLIVTDVVMPGMNGVTMAALIAEARTDVRMLYISGYTDLAILRHDLLEPGKAFLQKPFTADMLTRKVREVLDAAVPA